jgi:hypothetical protein
MFIVQFQIIQSSLTFEEKPRHNRLIFDNILNFLKLDVLWEKIDLLTRTTRKTMEVKYFKVKHKVSKNSLPSQLCSDFEKVSLKMSGKA